MGTKARSVMVVGKIFVQIVGINEKKDFTGGLEMRKMMTKKEIKELREKYIIGTMGAPKQVEDEKDRRLFRAAVIYVLGKVLGLPEQ
jgi:hypothetical protein